MLVDGCEKESLLCAMGCALFDSGNSVSASSPFAISGSVERLDHYVTQCNCSLGAAQSFSPMYCPNN